MKLNSVADCRQSLERSSLTLGSSTKSGQFLKSQCTSTLRGTKHNLFNNDYSEIGLDSDRETVKINEKHPKLSRAWTLIENINNNAQGRINPIGGMGPVLVGGQAGPLHVLRKFSKLFSKLA